MSLETVHDPFTIEPVKNSLYSSDSASFAMNNCSVPLSPARARRDSGLAPRTPCF